MIRVGKTGTHHGEGGRARTVLGLDHLVAPELNAVSECGDISLGELRTLHLGEQWEDGGASVTADDRHSRGGGVEALVLGDECVGTDDVEGGDTKEGLGVVHASLLEDLCEDRHGGVDRVGDHEELGLGAVLGARLGEALDDGCVGVEEIITGHSGLAGNASRDDDEVATGQRGADFFHARAGRDLGLGAAMADIRRDTYGKGGGERRRIRTICVFAENSSTSGHFYPIAPAYPHPLRQAPYNTTTYQGYEPHRTMKAP